MDRSWPAVDIHPITDLLHAALVDFDTSAIHERSPSQWRVFFGSSSERDRALATLRVDFPGISIQPVDVPDENWAARSQAELGAVRVGRIVVAPPWDVPTKISGDDLIVVIQPSMGFGTGHHATTRLCLAALQRLDLRRCTVVDVGTGSGVLAIAASLIGADRVVAFDDDTDAISSAWENLELNPAAYVTLRVDDLHSAQLDPADVVIANLTGGLLTAAASAIQRLAAPHGRLILSGLLASEEAEVVMAFERFAVDSRTAEDEWICLTLRT